MLRTQIGDRVLTGKEAQLFAETMWRMLELEIAQDEANPDWNPVFRNLTHEQQIFMLDRMARAALLPEVAIPEFTAEGESALAAVYEQMYVNVEVELDEARMAVQDKEPIAKWMFAWRSLILAAAKEKHLAEVFGGYSDPPAARKTKGRKAKSSESAGDAQAWPAKSCDDQSEWELILDALKDALFFDRDWLLSDVVLDLPVAAAEQLGEDLRVPEGYFGRIHPDPLPAEAREIFIDLVLFLRRFLGYDDIPRNDVGYYGPAR